MKIYDITTEYKKNPIGLDETTPRFSYKIQGTSKEQISRQIIVRDNNDNIVWDSGTVYDSATIQIPYEGSPLKPFTKYSIKIIVEDENKNQHTSDDEAFFETGFLNTSWEGKWIDGTLEQAFPGRTSQVRKVFTSDKPIKQARLYISALGLYKAYINGTLVSQDELTPGWTDYNHRVQYQAYDVTELINNGENCFAAFIAQGWYIGTVSSQWIYEKRGSYGKNQSLIAELHITYLDDTMKKISTDGNFQSTREGYESPIRTSDIYAGERFEAFRDNTNWKIASSDGLYNSWCRELDKDIDIIWNRGATTKCMKILKPKTITKRTNGTWIVDFGQNFAGKERITLHNTQRGQCIVIKHGEWLNEDGSLYTENLRSAAATTMYTTGTHDIEVYEPFFTFYGFQYLEISGWNGELTEDDICACVIHSDLAETGSFECSDPLINKLFQNIVWGQRSNFVDIPTDCPQRNERYGWTADTQVFMNTATYNMYAPEFYRKWIEDLNLSLLEKSKCFADFVPDPFGDNKPSTAWADAGIICPWNMYVKYGDINILKLGFDNMKHWIDWQIDNANGELIVDNTSYGDWLTREPTSNRLLCTAYLSNSARLVAEIAKIIGKSEDHQKYMLIHENVKKAFQKEFIEENGFLKELSQTAIVLAIAFNLLPEELVAQNAQALVKNIVEKHGNHISTGFVGTPLILDVLTMTGYVDEAYNLLTQTTFPAWLYPVTQGATTMWERWNTWTKDDGFGDPLMNSFNHYAYGAVAQWFYETICGIKPDTSSPETVAFKKFFLSPEFGTKFSYAKAQYESMYGMIKSSWQRIDSATIEWSFSIPCNTSATIKFPKGYEATSTEIQDNSILSAGDYTITLNSK